MAGSRSELGREPVVGSLREAEAVHYVPLDAVVPVVHRHDALAQVGGLGARGAQVFGLDRALVHASDH